MVNHSKQITQISGKLNYYRNKFKTNDTNDKKELYFELEEGEDLYSSQQEFMNFILHSADIGHAAKPWNLEVKWSNLVFEEFFNQGDLEKTMSLPISYISNRDINLAQFQISFINKIVYPNFELLLQMSPELEMYLELIDHNLNKWKEKSEKDL